LWKGGPAAPEAEIDVVVDWFPGPPHLRHFLSFGAVGFRFELRSESILEAAECAEAFYTNLGGSATIAAYEEGREGREWRRADIGSDQSVVSQVKAAGVYPEVTFLGREYDKIRVYREWDTGPQSGLRALQRADLPPDFLLEDASNLCLVLNDLKGRADIEPMLIDRLREFHEPITGLHVGIYGGPLQVSLHERGLNQPIPASRLSDGTLRYLCLLAILCHPSPPPLICIEEPEIGLHPDILPTVAKLLVEASQRTQLIVTTHSGPLVDALTGTPEAVVVCEKEEGSTAMHRLNKDALKEWLDNYSLGHLWRTGELGGNRW
jgi:predicted ATPase